MSARPGVARAARQCPRTRPHGAHPWVLSSVTPVFGEVRREFACPGGEVCASTSTGQEPGEVHGCELADGHAGDHAGQGATWPAGEPGRLLCVVCIHLGLGHDGPHVLP